MDPDLVNTADIESEYEIVKVPAMKMADDMGLRLVSNMIMLGALVKKSGLFGLEALEKAIAEMVPEKFLEANIRAINAGAELV